jgi:hypothetical protein
VGSFSSDSGTGGCTCDIVKSAKYSKSAYAAVAESGSYRIPGFHLVKSAKLLLGNRAVCKSRH